MDLRSRKKAEALARRLGSLDGVVVAYSGGVDSAYLTGAAHAALGERALAVTALSPSLARRELDAARGLAAEKGWNHLLVETHEVERDEYARNAPDRCYWCKDELFETLAPIASERGVPIAVGTNADDLHDFRPGQRAARERGILAPLAEVPVRRSPGSAGCSSRRPKR